MVLWQCRPSLRKSKIFTEQKVALRDVGDEERGITQNHSIKWCCVYYNLARPEVWIWSTHMSGSLRKK